jgi:D-alanyl-lipoteichoic acid acyltransferase DltB (MBOAT superfamily)
MIFNSLDFAVFLPIVFLLYWFVTKSIKSQNALLLVASYLFYGWWDWRFLTLIAFSSLLDYFLGKSIERESKGTLKRKLLLYTSIGVNLGFLAFFKYFNFFAENFANAFTLFGSNIEPTRLDIVLPVGISFYTFQTLSYTLDIYKGKLKSSKDLLSFLSFVSFFPQLVAGPIERASNLLPQFYKDRFFSYPLAVDGMRQILWGLFKKVVIADNCAEYANLIFDNYDHYSGSTLILGAIFFTFQIYGDFSGYSDIAIGTSRLFGFDLKRNFAFPYFSRDIAEFWRKWHISLSTWFRDYLYIPLGGSQGGTLMKLRNTFIIFIVSGFWHGANWTFIFWGALNAVYFIPLLLTNNNRNNLDVVAKGIWYPSIKELFYMLLTFGMTVFAWIFFRAESLGHAFDYIRGIFSFSVLNLPEVMPIYLFVLLTIFIIIEWIFRDKEFGLQFDNSKINKVLRWSCYIVISFAIAVFFGKGSTFIYFQF